jgi:xanthine dehydrogenase iron-sulfur cluster and FAD-binding subunit A
MSDIRKRLEHKISALDHDLDGDLVEDLNNAYDAIEARDKRIAELEAALKPFADNAQFYENSNAIYNIDHDDRLTVADLRNARKALENG